MQRLAALAALIVCLAACGSDSAATPTAIPPASPTPRPTVQVGFDVAVTPAAIRKVRKPVRQPRPAPFVPPRGPYLTLHPNSGPPLATTMFIQGGHLPTSSMMQILWAPRGHKSAISQTAYTDAKGNLSTELEIPPSQPGVYFVTISLAGLTYAVAQYRVKSPATLAVRVSSGVQGDTISITGKHFISRLKLALFAYPMVHGAIGILLGNVRANRAGSFLYSLTKPKLAPGQYVLQAWSSNALSSQMAETFFEVMI